MTPAPVRGMRAAFLFMTRIPLGGFPYSSDDFRWASAHFPLVGFVIGALGSLPLLLAPHTGTLLAAVLAVGFTIWCTGAFHEDGLADTADALGGAHSRKKIHDILKDSRIGTYGGTALCLSLLIRCISLSEIVTRTPPTNWATTPLLFALIHGLARTGPVGLMVGLDYVAGEGAKGSSVATGGPKQLLVALVWVLAALVVMQTLGFPLELLATLLGLSVTLSFVLGAWFKRRTGGFTGDFSGATEQGIEISLLLAALLLQPTGFVS